MLEIFSPLMESLFTSTLEDPRLLRFMHRLLQSNTVARPFADVLLSFLVDKRLDALQQPTSKAGPPE